MASEKEPAKGKNSGPLAENRKANFNYAIVETLEAGIQLRGTEVKACRAGKINLSDGYAAFRGDELYLQNVNISEYSHGNRENHAPLRTRKLLLHRKELNKLISLTRSGMSLIPLRVYIKNSHVKVLLGLGKGKKTHDKREDLKKKQATREIERSLRR